MPGEDQRQHRRRDVDLTVKLSLDSAHHFYVYAGRNVSSGGLFVASEQPLPPGATLVVRFTLPGWEVHPIEAQAIVRWVRPADGAVEPGMGLEFTGLSATARMMIEEFIADRGGALVVPAQEGSDE